ncbi:heparinase II/III family protein [Enterococcus sp. BWR-S5]|uniref:heparinase II/III family protein n=1 Tax=Enterococcus sp. BWR-S5 TaxID=2787714 RepID=UPI0019227015|nr:heparinase II/III family protein [Enterococcus sp. BWR-S5]MBL1225981.1 heparinase II/III family protein [Enterococcus sp. BWR-S5]
MSTTKRLEEEIKQEAKKYLQQSEIAPLPVSGYEEYLKSGNRLKFEQAYFNRRRQLTVVALAVYLGEQSEELQCFLEQIIWEVCNEYTWALPAHLSVENNLFSENSPFCIDLFAAETGQTLAEIMTLMGSSLSPLLKQRIQGEIERRIFQPFEKYSWGWEKKENNWSAVIAGCIGMTALSLLPPKSARLQQIVKRLETAMASYLSGFGEDGACVEGVGYWGYGFGYFIYYAEQLAKVLGDEHYLKIPKVKAVAAFPYRVLIDNQKYVPFSDYSQPELPSGLISFCGDYFGVPIPSVSEANQLDFDHCYRFAPLLRNLLWTKAADSTENSEFYHYFEDAQWAIVKSEQPQFFFAAKGGSNEESHNHLDIGHFIFGNQKTLFLTDIGAGEYTRDYFVEAKRYRYFPTSAASHHLPIINGQTQQPGAVAAQHVNFDHLTASSELTMELQETYTENKELTLFKRSFKVNACKKSIELKDSFNFQTSTNEIVENFVTMIPPVISGSQILLQSENQGCVIDVGTTAVSVVEKCYQDHHGSSQKAYQIQARYKVALEAEIIITIQLEE